MEEKNMLLKKGNILTVGQLKLMPKNSIIHLLYIDNDGQLRNNGFVKFSGYDGNDELCTICGFTMPINGLKDNDLLENINNSGWRFTVSGIIN